MNPYVPLFAIMLAIGLFGSGISVGVKWEKSDSLARELATTNAALEATDRAVAAATRSALAEASKAEARRAAARAKKHDLEVELARDETARKCRVSDGTLRVLNDAIDTANGVAPQARPGNGVVSPPATTGGAGGFRLGPLDFGFGSGLLGVPGASPPAKGVD